MKTTKNQTGWYFMIGVLLIYVIIYVINPTKTYLALSFFKNLLIKIIPIIILIFILTTLINYFVKPKTLIKYLGKKSGIKGWIITIIAGILSTGPIYTWYPLLKDLQKQGMRTGLITAFLYNRAVKIPLLPLLILYFGLIYSIILTIMIVLVSVIQGIVIEKIIDVQEVKK